MIERVSELLGRCGSDAAVLVPTELYNEGWMLRLVLDWFDRHRGRGCELGFLPGARWFSEARLASAFLPEYQGDPLAESHTHVDGLIGHFSIHPDKQAEAMLLPGSLQLVAIEAKMGSGLSKGVKNAPTYDQAARTVACIANVIARKQLPPTALERLAFFVVAPQGQIRSGVFGDLVTKPSIVLKVEARVAQYNGARDRWFSEDFMPLLDRVDLGLLSWESILDCVALHEPESRLPAFYERCLQYNL